MKLTLGSVPTKAQKKTPPPPCLSVMVQESRSPQESCTKSFDLRGEDIQPPVDLDCSLGTEGLSGQQLQTAPVTICATAPVMADKTSQSAEGAMGASVITAPAPESHLPSPELGEDGRVLPPCSLKCFPAPHPAWAMQVGNKELNDLLPKTLPIVPGVVGNRSTTLLSLDFEKFIPKGRLSDSQAHLQTASNIQVALRKALIHPAVERSLLSPPTAAHHPGLVTVEDLRCLSPADRTTLNADGIEFFFPVLQGHLLGGTKIQQYLLACLVFGWYPAHFRQKKVAKETRERLTYLADHITEHDGGSATFQSCKTITMCPFKDCLFMCSSQYTVVKHAMWEHYHTLLVCGSCLCHFVPSLSTNITMGRTFLSLKEHILMCGNPADPSLAETSAGKEPSARSTPVSVSSSIVVSGNNASTIEGSADGAGDVDGAVDADGAGDAEEASMKHNLAAVFGGGTNGSDAEEEAERASKKRNRSAVFGGQDNSAGACPSKWRRKTQK